MSIHKIPIFMENPYDIQCILDGLKIAESKNKQLLYIDRLLATLRLDPEEDIVNISYRVLLDLNLLKLETAKN